MNACFHYLHKLLSDFSDKLEWILNCYWITYLISSCFLDTVVGRGRSIDQQLLVFYTFPSWPLSRTGCLHFPLKLPFAFFFFFWCGGPRQQPLFFIRPGFFTSQAGQHCFKGWLLDCKMINTYTYLIFIC